MHHLKPKAMKCKKYLNSIDEIQALIEEVRNRRMYNQAIMEHYRGQGRPEYQLLPTIARGATVAEII